MDNETSENFNRDLVGEERWGGWCSMYFGCGCGFFCLLVVFLFGFVAVEGCFLFFNKKVTKKNAGEKKIIKTVGFQCIVSS